MSDLTDVAIVDALQRSAGNVTHAAEELGVARTTLRDRVRSRNLDAYRSSVGLEVVGDGLSSGVSAGFTEVPVVIRDYSHLDELRVYPLGDIHKGSPAHAQDKWLEWLAYLEKTPGVSLLGTGDFLNSALKTSVSETYDEIMSVGEAKRELRRELDPLAVQGKVDLLIPGNHEARIYRAVGDCPILDVADYLDIPYASDAALVVYQVGEIQYEVYVIHGTGGGMVGARANRLARQAQTLQADVYVSGHTHSQQAFKQDVFRYDPTSQRVVRRRQVFVCSGSFLNYEGYAARSSFTPQVIGAPRIRLDGRRHDVHVSI